MTWVCAVWNLLVILFKNTVELFTSIDYKYVFTTIGKGIVFILGVACATYFPYGFSIAAWYFYTDDKKDTYEKLLFCFIVIAETVTLTVYYGIITQPNLDLISFILPVKGIVFLGLLLVYSLINMLYGAIKEQQIICSEKNKVE